MRIAEKTLELSICSQLSHLFFSYRHAPFLYGPQPLWFGLTQRQEAISGFDAAAIVGGGRLLLLQFKAGHRLKSGLVRFNAPHNQLDALQRRLNGQHRLVLYVLPAITRTSELKSGEWLLERTWFLDVASIPTLGVPNRRSNSHHMTLDPTNGKIMITSDPVEVKAVNGAEILDRLGRSLIGGKYENFDKFWSYAKLLAPGSTACVLPDHI